MHYISHMLALKYCELCGIITKLTDILNKFIGNYKIMNKINAISNSRKAADL
jgi:hypothetical protein